MRAKTVREWTYEEVRQALEKIYGPIEGIKLSMMTGYVAEECSASEQPVSAGQDVPVKDPPPF